MQAIRPSESGGPEVLTVTDVPDPTPGDGQLLVRTEAIGVNYIDVYHRNGTYKTAPPIPVGVEAAGVVETVGGNVTEFRAGDRVVWCGVPGAYATLVVVPAQRAVTIPDGVDTRVAAAAMLQGLTAQYLATSTFPLGPKHTALIHAAAGGVGLLLIQFAKSFGARVIGTVSTPAKAELARNAGADDVILYTSADFLSETRRLTGGAGVDVVYDSVGKDTFEKSLDCLKPRGYLALYGQSSGPVTPFDPQLLSAKGSLFLTRPTFYAYTAERAELVQRADDLFGRIRAGALTVRIDRTLPLAEAAAAHRALEARETSGKILLVPGARTTNDLG